SEKRNAPAPGGGLKTALISCQALALTGSENSSARAAPLGLLSHSTLSAAQPLKLSNCVQADAVTEWPRGSVRSSWKPHSATRSPAPPTLSRSRPGPPLRPREASTEIEQADFSPEAGRRISQASGLPLVTRSKWAFFRTRFSVSSTAADGSVMNFLAA